MTNTLNRPAYLQLQLPAHMVVVVYMDSDTAQLIISNHLQETPPPHVHAKVVHTHSCVLAHAVLCHMQGLSQVWGLVRLPAPLLKHFQTSLPHHGLHCLLTLHQT